MSQHRHKAERIARAIAESHFKKPVKSSQGPRIQGFFSRTIFVTFKDGAQVVLQFRPEPLDTTPFHVARKALGCIVPEIENIRNEALEQDGIMTYHMTMMPGKIWCHAIAGHKTSALPIINKSLGEIFATGYLEDSSATVIRERLRSHLDLIITSDLQHVKPFQKKAKELSSQLKKLEDLPLGDAF